METSSWLEHSSPWTPGRESQVSRVEPKESPPS